MKTFGEFIDDLETTIEEALQAEEQATSYEANLIFERLHGAMDAINAWRLK